MDKEAEDQRATWTQGDVKDKIKPKFLYPRI